MVGLTEELRLVRRDGIDESKTLGIHAAFIEQVTAVFVEIGEAAGADALAQPAFDHRLLRHRHLDAAVVLDEPCQPLEITTAEMIETIHVRHPLPRPARYVSVLLEFGIVGIGRAVREIEGEAVPLAVRIAMAVAVRAAIAVGERLAGVPVRCAVELGRLRTGHAPREIAASDDCAMSLHRRPHRAARRAPPL